MMTLVYLLDSNQTLAKEVTKLLSLHNIECHLFARVAQLLTTMTNFPADIIVSEFQHPEISGLELCKNIRQKTDAPILFTTSHDDEVDRLIAYECGADDFMLNTFSNRELVAKIKAISNRIANNDKTQQVSRPDQIINDQLSLIPSRLQVSYLEQQINLTQVEFKILKLLMAQAGDIVSRQQMIESAYEDNRVVSARTIDSHIKKLRLKISPMLDGQDIIHSSYGRGYRYIPCSTPAYSMPYS